MSKPQASSLCRLAPKARPPQPAKGDQSRNEPPKTDRPLFHRSSQRQLRGPQPPAAEARNSHSSCMVSAGCRPPAMRTTVLPMFPAGAVGQSPLSRQPVASEAAREKRAALRPGMATGCRPLAVSQQRSSLCRPMHTHSRPRGAPSACRHSRRRHPTRTSYASHSSSAAAASSVRTECCRLVSRRAVRLSRSPTRTMLSLPVHRRL